LLVSIDYLVVQVESVMFMHLLPLDSPTIPGEMSWIPSTDSLEYRIMQTHTGSSMVAMITNETVGTFLSPPNAVASNGCVNLSWDVEENLSDGFIVYRRDADGMMAPLFEQPISAAGDQFSYLDNPSGYTEGTVLFYSYAIVRDGVEVGRSPETRIELNGLPVYVTRLLPNVPNPFNPTTEIHFELDQPGMVRVSVYDISGRLVETLVQEHLEAGTHTRLWEGRDLSGRQVPSGSYFLRLQSGQHTVNRKMLLIK